MSLPNNYVCEGQISIFDLGIWCGKTSQELLAPTTEKISERSLKRPQKWQKGMPAFLDLRGGQKWPTAGCIMGDGWSIAWRVHDAQFWGVPQRRKRIALVADFGGDTAPEILFERKSMPGDIEESGETREEVTKATRNGLAQTGRTVDKEPILLESNQNHATIQTDGISTALPASMGMGGGYVPMVMEPISFGNGQLHDAMSPSIGVAKTLNCLVDPAKIFTYKPSVGALCVDDYKGPNRQYVEQDKLQVSGSIVRRLTPMECERLQGYPDHWTDIGEWTDTKGKKHKDADSPRYKALGNSIALPFWQWMAGRMVKHIPHPASMASLFDGIGGFPLVFSRSGCKPLWASEIEEFPIAVTKMRFKTD